MRFLLIILSVLLTNCSEMKPEDYVNTEPKIKIEEYFLGDVKAWGIFQNRFGKVKRQFTAKMEGSFDGEFLTLSDGDVLQIYLVVALIFKIKITV